MIKRINDTVRVSLSISSWDKPDGRVGIGFDVLVNYEDTIREPIELSRPEQRALAKLEREAMDGYRAKLKNAGRSQ